MLKGYNPESKMKRSHACSPDGIQFQVEAYGTDTLVDNFPGCRYGPQSSHIEVGADVYDASSVIDQKSTLPGSGYFPVTLGASLNARYTKAPPVAFCME